MTDSVPAIALLFDDVELGAQLRDVLQERGAQIVHEGGVSTLSRNVLEQLGADVLVVNLDDSAEDALDHLYDMIDGERPRIVFNDAQASRALTGWDRARWARHLAVKVLAAGEIDPPRPSHAQGLDMPVEAVTEVASFVDDSVAPAAPDPTHDEATELMEAGSHPDTDVSDESAVLLGDDDGREYAQNATAESESLAAELEAMLASGDLPEADEELSGGLRFANGEEPPPLHDGDFGESAADPDAVEFTDDDTSVERTHAFDAEPLTPFTAPVFQTDHLQLSALTDAAVATIPAMAAEPATVDASTPVRAPDGWALIDEDSVPDAVEVMDAQAFGIEKLSAADFLAPDVESVDDSIVPTMSLELESIEQAIAPKAYLQDHEMVLDDLGSALSRLVVLGAAVSGLDSVCEFLAALPARTRLTFLHTQHLGDHAEAAVIARFAANCALPVRLAAEGSIAGPGEVLVVPAGQQVRLRRDGRIELQSSGSDVALDPSIDISLTMAAGAFGRDALAIVFAGRGNDAVAGAQAIHDRGGPVWVESSSGEHFADMVSGIFAERLVSFSGTPTELAAHLIEVFP